MIRRRDFRYQYGGDTCESASANAGQSARAQNESRGLGGTLKSTANKGKDGRKEKTVDSTDTVGSPSTDEAAKDGSEVVLNIGDEWKTCGRKIQTKHTTLTIPPCLVVLVIVPLGYSPMPTSRT